MRAWPQAGARQHQPKESTKQKAAGPDMVLESEKLSSHSRKFKGTRDKKAKKDPSKETPKDVRDKKKELTTPNKASKSKGKATVSKGSNRPSKGQHQDLEVEVVAQLDNPLTRSSLTKG